MLLCTYKIACVAEEAVRHWLGVVGPEAGIDVEIVHVGSRRVRKGAVVKGSAIIK